MWTLDQRGLCPSMRTIIKSKRTLDKWFDVTRAQTHDLLPILATQPHNHYIRNVVDY